MQKGGSYAMRGLIKFQFVGICFFERLPLAIGYFDSLRDAPPHGQCVPGAAVIVIRSLGSVTLLQFKFQIDEVFRI